MPTAAPPINPIMIIQKMLSIHSSYNNAKIKHWKISASFHYITAIYKEERRKIPAFLISNWRLDRKDPELSLLAVLDCGMGGSQTGNRNTERRAAYVVIADHMAELDGVRDHHRAHRRYPLPDSARALAAIFHSHRIKRPTPSRSNCLEWILGENALFNIGDEEVAFGIVTAVTKGHLGQVVGTEGEELGITGDFLRR